MSPPSTSRSLDTRPVLGKRQSPSLGAFPPHRPASLHATFRVLGSWFPPASSVRAPTMPDVAVTIQVPERNPARSRVVSIPPCHSTRAWVLSSCLALPYASCVHLSHFRDAVIRQEDAFETLQERRSIEAPQGWSSASTSIMARHTGSLLPLAPLDETVLNAARSAKDCFSTRKPASSVLRAALSQVNGLPLAAGGSANILSLFTSNWGTRSVATTVVVSP
ncbi:hypothetical protein POSPLADRAFT_1054822 [Postia placenta MAD-698-R-SB12]|uniref:Uncharacterized protein n=1 Tax=Postia placenta MAD-698-R-SB12 TaxID=670580 RepID=A0A1X6N6I2_9APHY|nr:hypothetical protein POSPLADRAFT_1054822 [Postia placenta MAD-698-R-SB12]OSX64215.1 hypothetical protein POSPLADRAFT_1054822 [Postia placenta MAD-698-R-SB12]